MAQGKDVLYQKKLAAKIRDRYTKSKNHRTKIEAKWRELDNFYHNEQYADISIPPWIPKPMTNYVHQLVTIKRAAFAMENPTGLLSAVSIRDVERVNQLQEIYEWVWKKIGVRNIVRSNIETSRLLGTAIAHVYWNEHTGVRGSLNEENEEDSELYEGEIEVREIDPSNFFPDPTAYSLDQCRFVHTVEEVPKEWVENTFGVKIREDNNTQKSQDTDIYTRDKYSDVGEENATVELHTHYEKYWGKDTYKVKEPIYEEQPQTFLTDDGQEMPLPDGEVVQEQIGEQERDTGIEYEGWFYRCYYMVGNQIIRTIPRLAPNRYPFAILYDYKKRKSFWGMSSAELILENQKLINKTESIMALIATMLQNPQKLVRKDSGINPASARKYSNLPGMVWEVNPHVPLSEAMRWADVPQVPQALFNLTESTKANIRDITGLNEAYMGQSVGSLQTSSGVETLVDRATLRDRDQMFDIEQYIEQLTRVIIDFVVNYYVDERWMKIVKDSERPNEAEFKSFIGRDFKDIEFDFDIDVSSKAPITRLKKQNEAKDLLQLQGQYGFSPRITTPQEYISMSDLVNKREIIDRMDKEENFSMMQKLQTALQMAMEATMQGIAPEQATQMAMQQLEQMQAGQAPADPFNPDNIPANMGEEGIGSAADNTGDTQMRQASLPPIDMGY